MSGYVYNSRNQQIPIAKVAGAAPKAAGHAQAPEAAPPKSEGRPFYFPYFPPALEKMGLAKGTDFLDIYKQQKKKFVTMESGKAKLIMSSAAFLVLLTTPYYWLSPIAVYFMLEGYRNFRIGELKYYSHNKRPIVLPDTPLIPSYRKPGSGHH